MLLIDDATRQLAGIELVAVACNQLAVVRIGSSMSGVDPRSAFLAAALPHLGAVYAIARRNTLDGYAAEDVAQETFLRAYAGFGAYRGESVRAWLAAICLNVLREQARRRAARPVEVLGAESVDAVSMDDPAAAAAAGEEWRQLATALATLSSEQREAIVLVDVAALTFAEAAAVLGCPRGTVLARVHRGRRRLAQLLVAEETAP